MRQAADEVASGDLLRMLQLLLAQAALIIHRGHFQPARPGANGIYQSDH